jgi:hypothetical protein
MRNPFIVPPMARPIPVSVSVPPAGIYVIIKAWNIVIVPPTAIIGTRAIPAPFPWTPPPAIPEKYIEIALRNNVHIVRVWQNYHFRGRRKGDRLRHSKIYAQMDFCPECLRQESRQSQKEYP